MKGCSYVFVCGVLASYLLTLVFLIWAQRSTSFVPVSQVELEEDSEDEGFEERPLKLEDLVEGSMMKYGRIQLGPCQNL